MRPLGIGLFAPAAELPPLWIHMHILRRPVGPWASGARAAIVRWISSGRRRCRAR
jgi:hypothetical protein